MNTPLLRRARIAVALVFFTATTMLFLDFLGMIPPAVSNGILFLQFIPSTLKFIAIVSVSAVGFIIILMLTVLFGRVYCSSICPLGIMQDFVNWFSKKTSKKKKHRFGYLKEQKVLRLVLFLLPVIMFICGSALAINLLDPYSIYGRIAGNLFRPVIIFGNNIAALAFEKMKIYTSFSTFTINSFALIPFIITTAFFVFVIFMAWKKGRLYCNTVCPVGTLLGYISKFSLFKIVIDQDNCKSCGVCAKECKASCIDSKNKFVDTSRCVTCFDCVTSCPTDGIKFCYSFKRQSVVKEIKKSGEEVNQSKRNFLVGTGLYFLSMSSLAAQAAKNITVTKLSKIPILRKSATSPPGSISVERFNSKCTACHLCVSACPTQVLKPSFLEYGFLGMLQPRMDNNGGFCNFECKACSQVCPTGAIMPLDLEKKRLTQIGVAHFIKDNCIVNTQKTDCGACSEHCPTKAVHMVPFENNLVIPEVREDYCIGCGACEYACPVKPYKAIYIEGNRTHKVAKKNVEEKKQEKVNTTEEFPF
jgi:ferredoxin